MWNPTGIALTRTGTAPGQIEPLTSSPPGPPGVTSSFSAFSVDFGELISGYRNSHCQRMIRLTWAGVPQQQPSTGKGPSHLCRAPPLGSSALADQDPPNRGLSEIVYDAGLWAVGVKQTLSTVPLGSFQNSGALM